MERRSIRGRALPAAAAAEAATDDRTTTVDASTQMTDVGSSKGDGGASESEEALSVAGRYRRRPRVARRGRLTSRNDDDADNVLVCRGHHIHLVFVSPTFIQQLLHVGPAKDNR